MDVLGSMVAAGKNGAHKAHIDKPFHHPSTAEFDRKALVQCPMIIRTHHYNHHNHHPR